MRSSPDVARRKVYDVTASGCASARMLLPQPTPPSKPHPKRMTYQQGKYITKRAKDVEMQERSSYDISSCYFCKCKDVIAPTHPTQPTPPQHEAIRKNIYGQKRKQGSRVKSTLFGTAFETGAPTQNMAEVWHWSLLPQGPKCRTSFSKQF